MPRALPSSFSNTDGARYATAVRSAVSNTLDALNERFCEAYERSGCTCTVAVYCGALLTVANVGDSDAVLDTFSEMVTMTVCYFPWPAVGYVNTLASSWKAAVESFSA